MQSERPRSREPAHHLFPVDAQHCNLIDLTGLLHVLLRNTIRHSRRNSPDLATLAVDELGLALWSIEGAS
jgi:hypothetical protein